MSLCIRRDRCNIRSHHAVLERETKALTKSDNESKVMRRREARVESGARDVPAGRPPTGLRPGARRFGLVSYSDELTSYLYVGRNCIGASLRIATRASMPTLRAHHRPRLPKANEHAQLPHRSSQLVRLRDDLVMSALPTRTNKLVTFSNGDKSFRSIKS